MEIFTEFIEKLVYLAENKEYYDVISSAETRNKHLDENSFKKNQQVKGHVIGFFERIF